jgi:hypothetical protein
LDAVDAVDAVDVKLGTASIASCGRAGVSGDLSTMADNIVVNVRIVVPGTRLSQAFPG